MGETIPTAGIYLNAVGVAPLGDPYGVVPTPPAHHLIASTGTSQGIQGAGALLPRGLGPPEGPSSFLFPARLFSLGMQREKGCIWAVRCREIFLF